MAELKDSQGRDLFFLILGLAYSASLRPTNAEIDEIERECLALKIDPFCPEYLHDSIDEALQKALRKRHPSPTYCPRCIGRAFTERTENRPAWQYRWRCDDPTCGYEWYTIDPRSCTIKPRRRPI